MSRKVVVLAVLVAGIAAVAWADEITVGGQTYSDVRITAVDEGAIEFDTADGNTSRRAIGDVIRIAVAGSDEFNRAEALSAEGRFDAALGAYDRAAQTAQGLLAPLIRQRIAVTEARKAIEVRKRMLAVVHGDGGGAKASANGGRYVPGPVTLPAASQPATLPAVAASVSRPASMQSPKSPPASAPTAAPAAQPAAPATAASTLPAASGTSPASQPASGDIATVEALVERLARQPAPPQQQAAWGRMTDAEKSDALARHSEALTRWEKDNNFRGRQVVWTLTLEDVLHDGDDVVLRMTSPSGYIISAVLKPQQRDAASAVRTGQKVQVTGTLADYSITLPPSRNLFDTGAIRFGAALSEASVQPAKAAPSAGRAKS
jgi:hypothetical protein